MTDAAGSPAVRPATEADLRRIAEIRVTSWTATYAGHLPDSILARLDVGRNAAWFGRHLAANPGSILVVEGEGKRVDGYAVLGPARDDDAAGLGEVQAIYLDPGARGRGLGRVLFERSLDALRASGFHTVVLWVLTSNGPARRFYERHGFALDGAARDLDFDGTAVEEVRYRRRAESA